VQLRVIVEEGRSGQSVLCDARDALHALLGNEVEIAVEAVHSLLPEPSGKFLLAKRHFPLDTMAV
jgi:hypothetical protein